MPIFERFLGGRLPEQEKREIKTHKEKKGQLLKILEQVKANPQIYHDVLSELHQRNPSKFKSFREAERYVQSAETNTDAFGVAKLIDQTLGKGAFRTLSFLDKRQDSARSVSKLLREKVESTSFEGKTEKGVYLNVLESYGVNWSLEKTARDCVQNFFDANGQTLDGVEIQTSSGEEGKSEVLIAAPQDYDWKELIHFGGTTKQDSETDVGGFGEGIKVAAFVLLRDYGAKRVRAASRDWEIEYYFEDMPSDAYRKQIKGLYAKKRRTEEKQGNYLGITFEGEDSEERADAFEEARELFYSSENPDFQEASFDNRKSGGFKVLPPDENAKNPWDKNRKGHLYLAGQRTHFDSREEWGTVPDVNIWTWVKVQPKDRDRGMLTRAEIRESVLPLIVDSMKVEDMTKSVYDFKPLWDQFGNMSIGDNLAEKMVERLEAQQVKLEFEKEYLANDIPHRFTWISDALKTQGYRMCKSYMKKVGMKSALEQFKDLQSHNRVEATKPEEAKIKLLQEAASKIGLLEDEVKDVWLFSQEGEKSPFIGQYNGMFYWLSRETLGKSFHDCLDTYVHEAAHKDGLHGDAKFEYGESARKKKITQFILDHKDEWDVLEEQWKAV